MPLDGSEKSLAFLLLCLTGNKSVGWVKHVCQTSLNVTTYQLFSAHYVNINDFVTHK